MGIAHSLILSYFLGSIPFAYIIGRLKGVDISTVGDHNVGAFNVFRHAGLVAGASTLAADIGKGALAIVLTRALAGGGLIVLIAGGVVVAGDIWSPFLRFRGGRGVATTIGVLLVLLPREISITLGLAGISLLVTRHSIWCTVVLFVPVPLLCLLLGESHLLLAYSMALPCLSGVAHWMSTRHLPMEAQAEARRFWISPGRGYRR
jgi:acyl phosphate:glycerol-3-phosphate acyltransferase